MGASVCKGWAKQTCFCVYGWTTFITVRQAKETFHTCFKLQKLEHFSHPEPKDDFQSGLASLLAQDPKNNDAVISWIQDNVSEEERTKTPKDFIRTLAQLVSKSSFNHNEKKCQWSLNTEQLGYRSKTLKKIC